MPARGWTESLARACARRHWVTVGIWALAMVLAMLAVSAMLGDALVTEIEVKNNPESNQALTLMNERLGKTESRNLDELMIIRSASLTARNLRASGTLQRAIAHWSSPQAMSPARASNARRASSSGWSMVANRWSKNISSILRSN